MTDSVKAAQVALVTGASRGIGAAIALELAVRGYQVVGTATTDDGAARIGQALGLRFVQRAQRHTGFQPQFFHALNHLFQVRHIALMRVLPRRAHAKPR